MNKRITNICRSKWKNENEQYLYELQKFLVLTDNIEDEKLRKQIVSQMLKCDKCVTNLAEKIFENLNVNNK